MSDKVSFRGFRNLLQNYDEEGRHVRSGDWGMGRGGYDMIWWISYKGEQVIDAVQGVYDDYVLVHNGCLSEADFKKAFKIISEEYGPDFKIHPDTVATFKENQKVGFVF